VLLAGMRVCEWWVGHGAFNHDMGEASGIGALRGGRAGLEVGGGGWAGPPSEPGSGVRLLESGKRLGGTGFGGKSNLPASAEGVRDPVASAGGLRWRHGLAVWRWLGSAARGVVPVGSAIDRQLMHLPLLTRPRATEPNAHPWV
jgi:hypothetical protein